MRLRCGEVFSDYSIRRLLLSQKVKKKIENRQEYGVLFLFDLQGILYVYNNNRATTPYKFTLTSLLMLPRPLLDWRWIPSHLVANGLPNPCSHLPKFVADKCRRQNFLSATCQSKHVERARARRRGVADLRNACSDWSNVKECRSYGSARCRRCR